MDTACYERQAQLCKALSHPARVQLLDLLQQGMSRFAALQEATGLSKSNLSQHLSLLTKAGLVCPRREGQNLQLCLASDKVAEICLLMRELLLDQLQRQQDQLGHWQSAAASSDSMHP